VWQDCCVHAGKGDVLCVKCVILPYGKTNEASCIFSCGVTVLGDPD